MKKLLWIGDAGCDSGFARCTHKTLPGLIDKGYEVAVLGLNYRGDPHDYPYKIYPCMAGGDVYGLRRIQEIMGKFPADVVVIQNDPWNIPHYVKRFDMLKRRPILIGAVAVDGLNCLGGEMNGLDHVIFWTKFAQDEAVKGGLFKPSSVVPLGVDLDIYSPGDRVQARHEVGLGPVPDDAFIVLNINRNQPRKRLDLTVQYFSDWMHSRNVTDAYLYLHVCPTGDVGIDCDKLCGYYNLKGHCILAEPDPYNGVTEEFLAATYRAADVMMSTTSGEGWGLTTMEGMACGVPQILPHWSALGDWASDAAVMVPCLNRSVTWGGPNVIGGVPDKDAMIGALDYLYRNREARESYRLLGLGLAAQPKYRWENIARKFAEDVEQACLAVQSSPAVTICDVSSPAPKQESLTK